MRTTVICEISSNFQSIQDVKDSIAFADSLGCLPKAQAFLPEEIAEPGTEYYEKLKKCQFPRDWMKELAGTSLFYSVFGLSSLDFLENEVRPRFYKIASPQAVNEALIKAVAKTGKPTYLSVGGCTLDEIRQATRWFIEGCGDKLWWTRLTLMHAMVVYKKCDMQLSAFRDRVIGSKLIPWGWSQNYSSEENIHIPSAAVSLGASSCEIHFRLEHINNTPDFGHSLTPTLFKKAIEYIQVIEDNMGNTERPTNDELKNLVLARGRTSRRN